MKIYCSYDNAVNTLTSGGKFRISLGLDRMYKILELLGNPQDKLNFIHVAGTNGKGSVCSIISSILNQAGKKVGLYTSPHLFKYTERIKTGNIKNSHFEPLSEEILRLSPQNDNSEEPRNLTSISDKDFAHYVFKIVYLANKNGIDLTEFEILTAVMFKYFADNEVEVAVIETGLGGRYDATNVIKEHLCSIITHIDFDHTELLGDTLDKIAYEKAGIMKKDCPCIVFEGKEVYYDVANQVGALLEVITPIVSVDKLALKGVNQQENLALALACIEKVFPEIPQGTIDKGLQNVNHPCRFQYIKEKNLIIDGAHNPNGIKSLVQNLNYYFPNQKRRFIFGCLKNKDYETMINSLFKNEDIVYFYHFSHQNSATFDKLQKVCPIEARELTKDTTIDFNDGYLNIICGSLYMISELISLLNICI